LFVGQATTVAAGLLKEKAAAFDPKALHS